jgi:hypothetical protein
MPWWHFWQKSPVLLQFLYYLQTAVPNFKIVNHFYPIFWPLTLTSCRQIKMQAAWDWIRSYKMEQLPDGTAEDVIKAVNFFLSLFVAISSTQQSLAFVCTPCHASEIGPCYGLRLITVINVLGECTVLSKCRLANNYYWLLRKRFICTENLYRGLPLAIRSH